MLTLSELMFVTKTYNVTVVYDIPCSLALFTMGFFGLCSHGVGGAQSAPLPLLKIFRTKNDQSMKVSSQ